MPHAAPSPAGAPPGIKTIMVRLPVELATWASAQARREDSNLTQKIRDLLRDWRTDVEKAERASAATAEAQRQAEIQAAVSAALRRKGKPPQPKRQSNAKTPAQAVGIRGRRKVR